MNTHNEPAPLVEMPTGAQITFGQGQAASLAPVEIDPNNPPWGVVAGVLTLVGSIVLLILMAILALLFIIPSIPGNVRGDAAQLQQFLSTDKTSVFLQIVSTIPAHLLTLVVAWAVVTRFGKRPFWKSLGWSWSERFGPWKTVGIAVALFAVGLAIGNILKGPPTEIDQIANNSIASRYALAFIASVTAPFIEELVFRGVLYSALQKAIGIAWSVAIVSFLFALVHVWEYRNNVGVILVISILSLSLTLLRAYSGRLLPSYIVHLIFNGITAVYIIIEPYLPQSAPDVEHKAPAFLMLARSVRHLFCL